jgi:mRNA-degrading endonuclease RelE of RelBE toxin-antitoxin system
MFRIEYAEGVVDDLAGLRAFDRKKILDRIEQELTDQPKQETRNRKTVPGLTPPWEHVEPIWELRVGEHRVFYDVDEPAGRVTIRAIRQKRPHKTTEEIL